MLSHTPCLKVPYVLGLALAGQDPMAEPGRALQLFVPQMGRWE